MTLYYMQTCKTVMGGFEITAESSGLRKACFLQEDSRAFWLSAQPLGHMPGFKYSLDHIRAR